MGRVKVEIKKIENASSRQVTFAKRRNGLIKKAYELSVLSDIDVAVIMFSPSGRPSFFFGKQRVEDIITRIVNLPVYERGPIQNQESLEMTLERLKQQSELAAQLTSPRTLHVHVQELQQDIDRYQRYLEEIEQRLRVFEGDPLKLSTLQEIAIHEHILQETLLHVQTCKIHNADGKRPTSENANQSLNLVHQRHQQAQTLNVQGSNSLLSVSGEPQALVAYTMVPSGNQMNLTNQGNSGNPSNGSGMNLLPSSGRASGDAGQGSIANASNHNAMEQLEIPNLVLQAHQGKSSSSGSCLSACVGAVLPTSFWGQIAAENE